MASDFEINIIASVKEAEKALKGFSASAQDSLKSVEGAFTFLKTAAIAAVGFLAVGKIVDSLNDAAKAASEQEAAINSMNIAMATAGRYTQATSQEFQNYASEVQKTTGLNDDLILSQLAIAENFARSNDEAKKLVKAAIELSSATGTDLQSAVQALGKSLQGTEGSLGKMIPTVKGLTEAQLKNGEALDFVLQKFGGTATAKINTYEGAITSLKNAFEDVEKAVGKVVISNPVLQAIIQKITKIVYSFEDAITKNSKAIGTWVSDFLKLAVDAIPYVIEGIRVLLIVIEGFITGLIFVKGSIVAVYNILTNLGDFLSGALQLAFFSAVAGVQQLEKTFLELLKAIPGVSGVFKNMGFDIDKSLSDLDARLENSFNNISSGFIKVADTVTAGDPFAAIADVHKVFGGIDKAIDVVKNQTKDFAKEVSVLGSVSTNVNEKMLVQMDSIAKAQEKLIALDEQRAMTLKGTQNPLVTPDQAATFITTIRFEADSKMPGFLGQMAGGIQAALSGAEGATKMISNAIGNLADAALPGIGGAVTAIAGVLAKGPEFVKGMVKDFIKSIPEIIDNIIDSLPAIFQAIIDVLGTDRFWSRMLAVWVKLALVWTTAVQASGLAWNAILTASGFIWNAVLTASGAIWNAVVSAAGVIWEGVITVAGAAWNAIVTAAGVIWNAVITAAGAIWNGILTASGAVWEGVLTVAGWVWNTVVTVAGAVWTAAVAASAAIQQGASALWAGVMAGGAALWAGAGTFFSEAIAAAAASFSSGSALATAGWIAAIILVAYSLRHEVYKLLEEMSKVLNKLGEELGRVFTKIGVELGNALRPIIEGLMNFLGQIGTAAAQFVGSIVGGAVKFVGQVITGISDAIGGALNGLRDAISNFGKQIGNFATSILNLGANFIKSILDGAGRFINVLVDEVKKAFGLDKGGGGFGIPGLATIGGSGGLQLGNGNTGISIGGAGGGISGSIAGVGFRLFEKGGLIPEGYPNDSFPAGLSSGELVVPKGDVDRLHNFLTQNGSYGGDSDTAAILKTIQRSLDQSNQKELTVNLVVGQKELASVLLNLNRQGFRTA